MCVVSMIGDHYNNQFEKYKQYIPQQAPPITITDTGNADWFKLLGAITRQEFDDLKKQVEQMKALLIKAKIYDEKNNEPNCEMESKMATLRAIAKLVGVDLDDILGKTPVTTTAIVSNGTSNVPFTYTNTDGSNQAAVQ